MEFQKAYGAMCSGSFVRVPEWTGYWFMPRIDQGDETIAVRLGTGEIVSSPYLDKYAQRTDWEVVPGLGFDAALKALRMGKNVTREGWNAKGMFVFKQIPSKISMDIIPGMQSVPHAAKIKLIDRNSPINYSNQMILVQLDGRADSWVPSSSDIFAQDWIIL